jgi:hypothetical protein
MINPDAATAAIVFEVMGCTPSRGRGPSGPCTLSTNGRGARFNSRRRYLDHCPRGGGHVE